MRPNAVRIGPGSNHGNLITTAFRNSDGSKVVQVLNNSGGNLTFRVVWNNASFTYTLSGNSVVSFKWNGTGNPNPPANAPIGSVVTLRGNNNMFVSGENGTQAMRCDRASAGTWEQFAVIDAGNGKIGLRSMNKFVSSENGAASGITCNRTTIGGTGSWEHFDWVVNPGRKDFLRGSNAQYVTSNNGVGAMTCNKATVGAWEAFTVTVVGTARQRTNEVDRSVDPVENKLTRNTLVYPNPVVGHKINVDISDNTERATITLTNADGRIVSERETTDVSSELDLDKNIKPGLYYMIIRRGEEQTVKRVVIRSSCKGTSFRFQVSSSSIQRT